MASKNIKGITIKIGGDTTELTKALKDVNSVISKSNSELKNLNQALKLDPKNTELLSQKQEVLKNNIKATTERLNTLKEAQKQMGAYNSLTDEQKESYRALSVEIAKGESALKGMKKELHATSTVNLEGLKEGLKKVGDVALDVSKKLLQVSAAVGTALSGVVAAGVKSFSEFEQNIGGVETLFKENYEKVVENAKNAWKTAGLSANEYMQNVTSFSASLLQSLDGDTQKAAAYADRAMIDMSDNANKMGTSIEMIQNAYQGFAKQNYTMLDNLKLGYGGTKTEMERLIKDASGMTEEMEKLGISVDATDMSFGNIVNAISVMQLHMGIAGTTADEAKRTITGSVNAMKAAFDNFLNGSGSPEVLAEAVTNVFINIGAAISELAPNILNGIVTLIQTLLPQVIQILMDLIPQLLDAITSIIDQLLTMLQSNTDGIASTISTLIDKVVEFITTNLPKIIEAALLILEALALGIVQSLPTMIPSIIECILTIVDTLIEHLDEIIDAALQIILALAEGLIEALPKLIERLPEIITKIVMKLTEPEMLLKMIKASLQLILALGKGLIEAIPQLLALIPQIIISINRAFIERIQNTDWGEIGSNIIKGILNGFNRIGQYLTQKVNEVKDKITSKFKSIFGIHSPSTLMRDVIGVQITAGIGEGIEEGVPKALQDVDLAMKQLNAGIEASVNPVINPSMTYESNYALMAKAMKDALSDMVIELDDDKMGSFVTKTVAEEIYS